MAVDEKAVKFHTLGNTLMAEQKFNEAILNYQKAIDIAPDYAAAVYHLAEAFEAKQLEEKACEMFTRAIGLNPSYATEHIDAGLDSLLSGPLGKAVAAFKKSLAEEPPDGAKAQAGDASQASSQMVQQSAGEYDGPIAQKGLAPRKLIVEESDLHSEVNSCDTISVRVLGDRDVPVLSCPVEFRVQPDDPKLSDGALAKTMELLSKAPQPKLVVATDENGFASVYFRRSKFTGKNRVCISAKDLPEVVIEDNTVGSGVADALIRPEQKTFGAGETVVFSAHLNDKYGNAISNREMQFTLMEFDNGAWSVVDAASAVSDDAGVASYAFTLPTQSGKQCRLIVINKEAQFTKRREFTLISTAVGSALFIPMQGRVAAGTPFALKVKLLDEFDNPVSGKRAAIVVRSAEGGDWAIRDVSGDATGEDGSVYCKILPPAEVGARAVFTVQAQGIESESFSASFETAPGKDADVSAVAETSHRTPPMPGDLLHGDISKDFMDSVLPKPSDESADASQSLSGPGLDGIDYDREDADFALPQAAPDTESGDDALAPASALNALEGMLGDTRAPAPEPEDPEPVEPDPGSGSAFQALGDMLDNETPAIDISMPLPQDGDLSDAMPDEAVTGDFGLVAPDDMGEPMDQAEPFSEFTPDESGDEPIPLPDETGPAPAALRGGVQEIRLERSYASCKVGETVHLSLTAHDETGAALSQGVTAVFHIVEEPEDSDACFLLEQDTPGDKTYRIASQGSQYLTATLQAPTVNGSVAVEVSVERIRETINVDVLPGAADRIELSAQSVKLAPDQTTEILATVYDRYDNPLAGESVTFMIEDTKGMGGRIEEPVMCDTDSAGQARATFVSGGNPGDLTIITAAHDIVLSQSVQKVTVETEEDPAASSDAAQGGREEQFGLEEDMDFDMADMPPLPSGVEEFQPQQLEPPPPAPAFDPAAQPPPLPPIEQAAPPPLAPPQTVQPPMPPMPPIHSGGVEYMHDEFMESTDVDSSMQGAYANPADVDDLDDQSLDPDEYYEFEDPYAVPKFQVQEGRRPSVEWSELMPKIIKVFGVVMVLVLGVWGFTKSWTSINYLMNYNKANKLYNQQQLTQALEYYEKCTSIKPREAEPFIRMADIFVVFAEKEKSEVKAERYLKNAATQLNSAIDEQPENVEALYSLCHVYKLQGNYRQCISFCRQAIQVDPKFEAAQSDRKECQEASEEY